MHCYKVSEQILCLGTDFYNNFEMVQYNAINLIAFSERKRRIPSFSYWDVNFLHLKKPLYLNSGAMDVFQGITHKLNMSVFSTASPACCVFHYIHCVSWLDRITISENSPSCSPNNSAVIFLQSLFPCVSSYAWVFWKIISFLLFQRAVLLLVSLF